MYTGVGTYLHISERSLERNLWCYDIPPALPILHLKVNSVFSSKRALHNHMIKSKNARYRSAGSEKLRGITRPGDIVDEWNEGLPSYAAPTTRWLPGLSPWAPTAFAVMKPVSSWCVEGSLRTVPAATCSVSIVFSPPRMPGLPALRAGGGLSCYRPVCPATQGSGICQ